MNYAVGTAIDFDVIKNKMTASLGYRYERANGSNDFATRYASAITTPINELDDYIKNSFNAKGIIKLTKSISMELGYAYDNLKYSDAAYAGYILNPSTDSKFYALSGAYANPNYSASVVYSKLTYKF